MLTCQRCQHAWEPRTARRPLACPQCNSRRWQSGDAPTQSLIVVGSGDTIEAWGPFCSEAAAIHHGQSDHYFDAVEWWVVPINNPVLKETVT